MLERLSKSVLLRLIENFWRVYPTLPFFHYAISDCWLMLFWRMEVAEIGYSLRIFAMVPGKTIDDVIVLCENCRRVFGNRLAPDVKYGVAFMQR